MSKASYLKVSTQQKTLKKTGLYRATEPVLAGKEVGDAAHVPCSSLKRRVISKDPF